MDDNDILDLAPLPLDDAMIKYAYICGTMLCCEYGWREFKQLYECTETPDVLLDKFWDKIMPNLERNAIVRQTEGMARKLKQISNPRDYPPYPTRPVSCKCNQFWHKRLFCRENKIRMPVSKAQKSNVFFKCHNIVSSETPYAEATCFSKTNG